MSALDVSLLIPVSEEVVKQHYVSQISDEWERAKLKCITKSVFKFFVSPNMSSFVLAYDTITFAYRIFSEDVKDFYEGMSHVRVGSCLSPSDKFLVDDIKESLLPAMKEVLNKMGLNWKSGDTYACWVGRDKSYFEPFFSTYEEMSKDVKPADSSLAESLLAHYRKKYSGYSLEYFKTILDKFPCGVYYDEETGEPVGFAGCHTDGQAFVQIKEGYRGKQLGVKLLMYYVLQSFKHDIPIFAYTLKDNAQIFNILYKCQVVDKKGDVNFLFASPKQPRFSAKL